MGVLILIYLLLVFVLPLCLSAVVSYRSLPRLRSCGQCGGDTFPIVSRTARFASGFSHGRVIERRWCPSCDWSGFVRVHPPVPLPAGTRLTMRTVELRSVTVDGLHWGVRLECWRETTEWWGRLVFVAPSGRLWADGRALRGSSDHELLGRARALSEPALVSRLRALVSDQRKA